MTTDQQKQELIQTLVNEINHRTLEVASKATEMYGDTGAMAYAFAFSHSAAAITVACMDEDRDRDTIRKLWMRQLEAAFECNDKGIGPFQE